MSITHDRRRSISPIRVFFILSFAQDFKLSSIPAIEYKIPFITINKTQAREAMKVKYFTIAHIISDTTLKPVPTLHVYSPHPPEQFAPGTGSVTSTEIAKTSGVKKKKAKIIVRNIYNFFIKGIIIK